MPIVPRPLNWLCTAIVLVVFSVRPAVADLMPLASYLFQGTLAAEEAGKPALTAIDPLGKSGFQSVTINGQARQVYHFDGAASPATQQGGLSLNTTGLIAPNNYSIEMVFAFDQDTNWRRILDTSGRVSDNGLYIDPNNKLDVYDISTHPSLIDFTAGLFHHVVLTNDQGAVQVYLDGVNALRLTTTVMNVSNTGNLLNFFLDNVSGNATTEYSSGDIGLLRVYGGALDATQVGRLAAQSFAAVPEPSSAALLGAGVMLLGLLARARRHPRPPGLGPLVAPSRQGRRLA